MPNVWKTVPSECVSPRRRLGSVPCPAVLLDEAAETRAPPAWSPSPGLRSGPSVDPARGDLDLLIVSRRGCVRKRRPRTRRWWGRAPGRCPLVSAPRRGGGPGGTSVYTGQTSSSCVVLARRPPVPAAPELPLRPSRATKRRQVLVQARGRGPGPRPWPEALALDAPCPQGDAAVVWPGLGFTGRGGRPCWCPWGLNGPLPLIPRSRV